MPRTPVKAALLAALPLEVQPFLRRFRARRVHRRDPEAWEFSTPQGQGVAVLAGMGEVRAVRALAWLWRYYQPSVLISLGFGGAVTPELTAGTVVLGSSFWRYEPETGALEQLAAPDPPASVAELTRSLQAVGRPALGGTVVTCPRIIAKNGLAAALSGLSRPVLDLETATAAALAGHCHFLALRVVTDAADEDIPPFVAEACRQGTMPTWRQALIWLAQDPRRLGDLVRLWRRSRRAARHLGQGLAVLWPHLFIRSGITL